jgi:hypothetical protein
MPDAQQLEALRGALDEQMGHVNPAGANSTIKVLQKNPDQTVLILAKPRFWGVLGGCVMLEKGRGFMNHEIKLTFEIDSVRYDAHWTSRIENFRKPAYITADQEYRMLLRLDKTAKQADILKIWEGDNLLYPAKAAKEK